MLRLSFDELSGIGMTEDHDPYRHLVGSYPKLINDVLNDNLTKTQKRYIILYYSKGMTIPEIAALCDVNRSTVSRTLKRARERLKKAIRCELVTKAVKGKS